MATCSDTGAQRLHVDTQTSGLLPLGEQLLLLAGNVSGALFTSELVGFLNMFNFFKGICCFIILANVKCFTLP